VLDQHGVGQVPVDAGEIFKAEFVGAVRAVPRTRFLHLSLRLLARSYRHFANCAEPCRELLAADLRCRMLTRPPASVRPYIEPHSFCQDHVSLKPNRIGLHAFPCCSAADTGSFRAAWLRSIAGAFLAENA